MPQTKTEIQAILAAAGIRPLKRFGQHFLIDGNLMGKLVAAAELTAADVVLEVGPGTGSLTEALVQQCGHVVAVEIDRTLHRVCRDRVRPADKLTMIQGDVLERKTAVAVEVREALHARQRAHGGRLLLVANLPYQVATPLVLDLLVGQPRFDRLCFTVQAEVADRFVSAPGSRDYGPISVLAQAVAVCERIARVPPPAFWPRPKVDSAMLRMDPVPPDVRSPVCRPACSAEVDRLGLRHPDTDGAGFRHGVLAGLVHACFNHRRKTLKWSLRHLLNDAALAAVIADGRWDPALRPECLSPTEWIALAELLSSAG